VGHLAVGTSAIEVCARNAYVYYFDRRSPQASWGPMHGAEIGYVFGNLVNPTSGSDFGLNGTPSPDDVALSERMQSYWVNFAKTGDPNGPGLPRWAPFSASSQSVMYLDTDAHTGPAPNMKQIAAFDEYYTRARQKYQRRANP
jgi:para-nitrobenzyl esterase